MQAGLGALEELDEINSTYHEFGLRVEVDQVRLDLVLRLYAFEDQRVGFIPIAEYTLYMRVGLIRSKGRDHLDLV